MPAPPSRKDFPRLLRTLLAVGAAIVPADRRDDWRAEWEAELWHARRRHDALPSRAAGRTLT